MPKFNITVRTSTGAYSYVVPAETSCDAWETAASAQGDTPCGITVTPTGTL